MDTKEKIKVMQAYLEGKTIQFRLWKEDDFTDWGSDAEPQWNWGAVEYRVKPEPLELWVNIYDNGAVLTYKSEEEARGNVGTKIDRVAVHMREVIEDENK